MGATFAAAWETKRAHTRVSTSKILLLLLDDFEILLLSLKDLFSSTLLEH
jgi:hypothetical protein